MRKHLLLLIGFFVILIFACLIYWLKIRPGQIKKYCNEYANQEYEKKFGQPYFDPGPPYPVGQNTLNFWVPTYNSCLKLKGLE